MEDVSTLIEIPRFRGLACAEEPSSSNEVILESRWSIPINVSFRAGGQAYECACAIQEVTKGEDGIFRYRIQIIGEPERSSVDECSSSALDSGHAGTGTRSSDPSA